MEMPSNFYDEHFLFLVADTQLYKRLCPSVGRSVGWSVGWSVTLELKSGKTRISATGGRVSGLVSFLFHLLFFSVFRFDGNSINFWKI